jgi:4-methyl-5(b-hydroxyethyl)-thiazole monophosphate biosynthesis
MRILMPLINGFEEIEAISVVDILRRANFEVVTAGIPGTMVEGHNRVKVVADRMFRDIDPNEFDAIVLPGGKGSPDFARSDKIKSILRDYNEKKKLIAAICFSPIVLAKQGILKDRRATVYPGNERELPKPRAERVVVDGNIITSQGPGTAIEFALKIVEVAEGKPKAESLRKGLVCR